MIVDRDDGRSKIWSEGGARILVGPVRMGEVFGLLFAQGLAQEPHFLDTRPATRPVPGDRPPTAAAAAPASA